MDNQLIYNEIYREPRWHRWVDVAVILFIGVICGIVFTQGMNFYDVQTTTKTELLFPQDSPQLKRDNGSGSVTAPQKQLKFEQV